MPDFEDKIPISEFSYTNTLHNTDQAPIIQQDGDDWDNFRTSMADIGLHINKDMEYVTDLHTTSKKIIGAINELADGGGGSADIISEASGAIATFNDGGDNIPVKSLITEIVATQSGTGTPSPSNVRAISGRNSVNILDSAKNLIDINAFNIGSVTVTDGVAVGTANDFRTITEGADANIWKIPKTQLTWSFYAYTDQNQLSTGNGLSFGFYYSDGTSSTAYCPNSTTAYTRFSITSDSTKTPLKFWFSYSSGKNNVWHIKDMQLELGDTATDYEAYKGAIHTITLPETIYKGEVDVADGTGTKTFNAVDLGDLSYTYDSINTRMVAVISDLKSTGTRRTSFVCSCFQTIDDGRELVNVPNNSVYSGNVGNTQVYIQTTDYTDPAAFKTAMVGQTLVYPIDDTDIVFAPAKIPTLSGTNNIYSSTGDVEVEYFNENADQMAELIDAKQEYANYSSEEKVVGKWLDGSPLYEKTLYFNNVKLDKTDSTSELVHGVDNIGTTRFVAEVYFKFPNSGQDSWSPANNGLWNNGVYNFYWCVGETSIFILSTSGVYFDANPNYLVKIRYTKA